MRIRNKIVLFALLCCVGQLSAQFMQPVRTMEVQSTDVPMVINGVPYESSWGETQSMNVFMTDDWDGNADFSGNFRLTWDMENLYFHAEITDDIEQSAPEEISDVWMYDCIDIVIDLDTNNVSSAYDENTVELRLNRGTRGFTFPGRAAPEDFEYYILNEPDTGWIVEAAIPWTAVLPSGDPGASILDYVSNYIGFDVVFNDGDGTDPYYGERTSQAAWDLDDFPDYHYEYEMWHNTHVLGIISLSGNLVSLPVADAGENQTVEEQDTVYLDGTGSSDPGGSELTYTWTAPSSIALSDIYSPTPSFIAPDVTTQQIFGIELVVSNDTMDSYPDIVYITVDRINTPPVACAGVDTFVYENAIIFLNGGASSDADEDVLSYFWQSPDGLQFNDFTSVNPVVIAPEVDLETDFNFILTVYDDEAYSDPDTVVVTVVNTTSSENLRNERIGKVDIFPNPAIHKVQIRSGELITEVEILDLTGNLLCREIITSNQAELDLEGLNPGLYLLRVSSASSRVTEKIIIR